MHSRRRLVQRVRSSLRRRLYPRHRGTHTPEDWGTEIRAGAGVIRILPSLAVEGSRIQETGAEVGVEAHLLLEGLIVQLHNLVCHPPAQRLESALGEV